MAFRRRFRRRRTPRRRRRANRTSIRRRRFTRRRPRLTRRRILNITSRKLRDNVISLPIADDPTMPGAVGDPKVLTGDNVYGMLFCPSARSSEWKEGTGQYARDMTDIFVRGYGERLTFETAGLGNWLWRRIVFLNRSSDLVDAFPAGTLEFESTTGAPAVGQTRPLWNILSGHSSATTAFQTLEFYLYQGESGLDWSDRFSAKIDSRQITLLSDVTRPLEGRNGAARFHHFQDWFPVNKTLVYDEDEAGQEKSSGVTTKFSTQAKPGCGNLYVYDILACANGGISNELRMLPSGTFYWHER